MTPKKKLLIGLAILTPFLFPILYTQFSMVIATFRFGANPWRGKSVISSRDCTACHIIPGFKGDKSTGPALVNVSSKKYLARELPMTPDDLSKWLVKPSQYTPRTNMPDTKLSADDAKAVAAYLWAVSE